MNLQVLVSCMNQDMNTLIHRMNISSDAIIINQCDHFSYEKSETDNHVIHFLSFAERGVGLSRNTALSRADHDISLFSDEDIVYENEYEKAITDEFDKHPEADGIFFNIHVDPSRRTYFNTDFGRVYKHNSGRYATYSLAVKTSLLIANNITFHQLFGGGCRYCSGEDSLFIMDCLRKGLKLYRSPVIIGSETLRSSTWFNGYNDKYFYDRGVLYHFLYGKMAGLLAFVFLQRHKSTMCRDITVRQALKLMKKGIAQGKFESKSK